MRAPAEPTSARQKQRHARMLRAAARLGARHGFERMQMHDVAREADVAIATLYRYFPSKTHLFAAVMHEQVMRLSDGNPVPRPGPDPVDAVCELLVGASRQLLERPLLALAMMQSNNIVAVGGSTAARQADEMFRHLLLRTAGIAHPSDRDMRVVRILEQTWYGILTTILNERTTFEIAEEDIRLACRLLLDPATADRRPPPSRSPGTAAPESGTVP
ncbi:TetR family transcriptional regulator [Streptomyces triticisoli]|uniref:TetR family transcriptional regulator n=1 Tax=Streptomyces triticisoli TaxID=2182797 RepID=UPI001E3B5AC6|nr:TetR family transcriptional regulator [Streptomyces triticisoli]